MRSRATREPARVPDRLPPRSECRLHEHRGTMLETVAPAAARLRPATDPNPHAARRGLLAPEASLDGPCQRSPNRNRHNTRAWLSPVSLLVAVSAGDRDREGGERAAARHRSVEHLMRHNADEGDSEQ